MSQADFKVLINGVKNDFKIAIDDLVNAIEIIKEDVDKIKQNNNE